MRIFTRIGWGRKAAGQEPGPIRSTKTGSRRSQRIAGPVTGEPSRILIVGGGFVGCTPPGISIVGSGAAKRSSRSWIRVAS